MRERENETLKLTIIARKLYKKKYILKNKRRSRYCNGDGTGDAEIIPNGRKKRKVTRVLVSVLFPSKTWLLYVTASVIQTTR